MSVISTHEQFSNLSRRATRPITLIRWEHSGALELISLNGPVEFNGELYTSDNVKLESIQNNSTATLTLFPTAERVTQVNAGSWRNGKICQIYEIPAVPEEEEFVFSSEDAIFKLDGIIDNSVHVGGRITVSVIHKYLNGKFTPRYTVNDFVSSVLLPVAGSFVKIGTNGYQLKSRKVTKKEAIKAKALRGRLSISEINSFAQDDKSLDVETTADGAPLPVIVGRNSVPGLVVQSGVDGSGNKIYIVAWGLGQIFQVNDIFVNDAALPSTAIVHTYRGLKCQGVDNYAASITGITWTDSFKLTTPNGVACGAYSVIRLPSSTTEAPRFQAIIRGRLGYDPRWDGGTPDPFNQGGQTAVGYDLRFIGTNGTSPTTGIDISTYARTITYAGNAQIQSNKLSLDGTGDYVTVPNDANSRFGSGKWTLEITCTPSVHGEINAVYGVGDQSSNRCILISQIAQALYVSMSSNGTTWDLANGTAIDNTAFFSATTVALCIEFDGYGYHFYTNGVWKYYIASTSSLYASTATIQIGRNQTTASGDEFKGSITAVRMTKGFLRYGGVHTFDSAYPYADSTSNDSGFIYTDTVAAVFAALVKDPHCGLGSTETIGNLLNMFKWNESVVGGSPRATVSLVIADSRPTVEWLDQICGTYGDSFWFFDGAGVTVRPDKIADKYNATGWEMTTNGDFIGTAGDWTLGSGWSSLLPYGVDAIIAVSASGSAAQEMGKEFVAGDTYVATLIMDTYTTGSVVLNIDGIPVIEAMSAAGVYAAEFVADGTETDIAAVGSNFTGIVSEISIRRKFWLDDTASDITITPWKGSDSPNRIIATYREPSSSTANWTDGVPIVIELPGTGGTGMPVLETRVRYDGLRSSTKTTAKAKTKLYRIQGKDTIEWRSADLALLLQKGMVIELPDTVNGLTHYVLLENMERIEEARYRCRGTRYTDAHHPIDQPTPTGIIPVGAITPLISGSSAPTGYSLHTAANGKYIKGAGLSVAAASTAGAATLAALTGNTSSNSAHGAAEEGFDAQSYLAGGGSGSGRLYTETDDQSDDHLHTYDTGVITPDLYRREMILVKKTGSNGSSLPLEVAAFGIPGLTLPDTYRHVAYAHRLLMAAAAAANGGILSQTLLIDTGYTDDWHEHWTYTDVTNGTPGGTAHTDPHYLPNAGGGVHRHSALLELNRNVKRHKLALYFSSTTHGIGVGNIFLYEDALSGLHQDCSLCNGRLGTPRLEGRLLEIAQYGEEGQRRGNNTITVEGFTRQSDPHDHEGEEDDTDVPAVVRISHRNAKRHRHEILNPSAAGARNDWEPPSYALYPIMYNPNPVPTQEDVALYIYGGMPDGHSASVIDVGPDYLASSIGGTGTLAYSDDNLLFGLNTIYKTGAKRVEFACGAHGKKWTWRGFLCNDATGFMILASNYSAGAVATSVYLMKNSSGNIELYVGNVLRATVTLSLTSNEWFWWALCYDYAEFRLYAGKQSVGIATRATYTSAAFAMNSNIALFDHPGGFALQFTGYASQIQIIRGAAIYSASSIKIPTKPFQNWRSAHSLLGAYDWWDPCGIADGYYTNLAPDLDPATLPNNPGGRSCLFREVGLANATVRVIWPGKHAHGENGLMACVTPSATDFALGFNYEPALNGWVLWKLGKQPSNIGVLSGATAAHTDGVPVELSITVSGSTITCKADGVTVITATIPVALQGSTKFGVFCDCNRVPNRPENLPALVAPFHVDGIDLTWVFATGLWDDNGYWISGI